jgi:RHS repeat-associated protein
MIAFRMLLLVSASWGSLHAASIIVGPNRPLKTIPAGIAAMLPLGEDLFVYVEAPTLQYSVAQTVSAQPGWNGHKVQIIGMKNAPEMTVYVGNEAVYEFNGANMSLSYENIQGPIGNEGRVVGDQPSFYIKDHRGSTRMTLGPDAQISEANTYHSYGNSASLVSGSFPTREKFSGKEADANGSDAGAPGMNLDYFGARYYDPDLGNWISPDPAAQFNSLYATSGNPINSVDPDGLKEYPTEFVGPLQQGDWRAGDKAGFNEAAEYNLVNLKMDEYVVIEQRCQFYYWLAAALSIRNIDVKWVEAAAKTVDGSIELLQYIPGYYDFAQDGNKAIFDDAMPAMRELYLRNSPLVGSAAKAWDSRQLLHEQQVIDPFYQQMGMLKMGFLNTGNSIWNWTMFNLRNIDSRVEFGESAMGKLRK